jgi:hypothetical protein
MLMFVSIETARDRSHIIAEDLCHIPVEKYIAGQAEDQWDSKLDTPQQPCPAQTATTAVGDEVKSSGYWKG